MGTNTSDVEVRPQRDGSRVMTSEDNTQAFHPVVDVILPTGINEQMPMPHINLSISGYNPESLRFCWEGGLESNKNNKRGSVHKAQ